MEPKRFSNILGVYLFLSILVFCIGVMYWTRYTATDAVKRELVESFEQRCRIAENIIEREVDRIENALHEIQLRKKLILEISTFEQFEAQIVFEKYADAFARNKLDILFISKLRDPIWINASAPFPDTRAVVPQIADESRKLISAPQILRFQKNSVDITAILISKRIILDDGEVFGVVVGGTVLNENMSLINTIKNKTKSASLIFMHGQDIIATTESRKNTVVNAITQSHGFKDIHYDGDNCDVEGSDFLSSLYKVKIDENASSLSVLFSINNDLFNDLHASYNRIWILLASAVAAFLFTTLLVIRRLTLPSLNRLINYTTEVSLNQYGAEYKPGPILELNRVGVAVEKMVASINEANSRLHENEEKYRNIVENAVEGLFQSTPESCFISANPAFSKMLGYESPEELVENITDIESQYYVDPDDRQRAHQILQETGHIENFEHKARCKDGFHIWLSSSTRAYFDQNDEAIRYEGIVIDITKRKMAEKALRESEEKFRTLFDTAPMAIALTNMKTGEFIDINNKFCKISKYTKNELVGNTTTQLGFYSAQDRNRFMEELTNAGKVDGMEMDFKIKDGSIVNTFMFAGPIHIEKEILILTGFYDITKQKRLETQLQQSQKMESIGTLAGGIAHDFNNILFPIIGNTEMLLDDIPNGSHLRGNLNEVFNAAMRAKDLVKQILAFSRQDSNEIKLVRMQPVIKDALKLIRSTIPTSIEIKQYIKKDCGLIKADPTQIHQVVMNLATNAYHAMEDTGGELKVNLREVELDEKDLPNPDIEAGPYACLTVADSGPGIDKNVRERIFDPYFTTKEQGKGTGMGLSVVHGIVKNAGGSIRVHSEPGKGTEFHVYLPVMKSSFEQQETHSEELLQRGNEQILLVDDEDAIVFLEKQMLERLGYSVVSHTSSVEALEAFRANPDKYDLVITDMAMPNMNGDQLASELNIIRPGIPILLCTGFSEKMPDERVAVLGIKGFLMKPIVRKDLSNMVREVLDQGEWK